MQTKINAPIAPSTNAYQFPLALYGASGREDLLGEELGRVGLRLGVVDGRGFDGLP